MKCPHCNKDIADKLVLQEAARISGRRSKRTMTTEQARATANKRYKKDKERADVDHKE